MNPQTELDMRAVEFRADGSPLRYEVVPAAPAQRPRIIGADDTPIVAPIAADRTPRVQYIITGTPIDEAVGFNRRVYPLALGCGILVVTLAIVFGASLSFWLAAIYFGTAFGATWLLAFLWDTARSPGGIELINALHLWSFLRREQQYRHNRQISTKPDGWLAPLLFTLATAWTLACIVGVIVLIAIEQMP